MTNLIDQAKKAGRILQAGQLCQDLLTARPDHPQAVWLKMCVAVANVHLGEDAAVDTTLQDMIAHHRQHNQVVRTLCQVGRTYEKLQRYDKARPIYQYMVDHWADKPDAMMARTALVCSLIYLKETPAAESHTQLLIEQYDGKNGLPFYLNRIGSVYFQQEHYPQAKSVFEYFLNHYPEDNQATLVQKNLILCYLGLDDTEAALAATEVLLNTFADRKNAPGNIAAAAWAYRGRRLYETALKLYKFNLERYPQAKEALSWMLGYVRESLELGDLAAVNEGVDTLFNKYWGKTDTPSVALRIGTLLVENDHPRAAEVLQKIIDSFPSDKAALTAWIMMGYLHIYRGDDAQAESIFQHVLRDGTDNPDLPILCFLTAEGYWDAALKQPRLDRKMNERAKTCFQKAAAKFEGFITQFPNAPRTAEAHHFVGECYYKLGQYEKAIEYFQKTVDNFPDYEDAWVAQSRIAKVYKFMLSDGLMPEREAEAAMTATYEKLIANFPDCPIAGSARKWLERYAIATEGGRK